MFRRLHPIFFDDNIHNDPADSIVAVRARSSRETPYVPLSGAATVALQGLVLVRVPTLEAVLDHTWFLSAIRRCEARLDAEFSTPDQHADILKMV